MMIPIRCFSCGKVVGEYYEEFSKRVSKGEKAEEVLNSLGVDRYCCRRMLLSHVDLMDDIIRYSK